MTLKEFKNKYLGKQVEYHSYGSGALYQCVDLCNQYIVDVLGLDPIIGTHAKDFNSRYNKEQFEYIENTPTGVPSVGDIVIWGYPAGNGFGHVAIFLEGTATRFKSLDQNWSALKVTEEGHYYTNVIGWLTPKVKKVETIDPSKQLPESFRKIREFKEAVQLKLATDKDAFDTLLERVLSVYREQDIEIKDLVKQLEARDRSLADYKKKMAEMGSYKPTEGTNLPVEQDTVKMDYPTIKKIGWRFLRTFVAVFLIALGSGLGEAQPVKALVISALSGALVATGKAVREYVASDDFNNLVHKLPL